ncbi:MAG TPA: hypothetical protein VI072_27035 [Polyangiaceae bacterium]
MKRHLAAWSAALLVGYSSSIALAQDDPPPPNYTVDAAQGPVTGSTRMIGLGGAFVAIAEGGSGVAVNPASVAVRAPWSWNRLDYGFSVDFAIGAWLPETDFLNQGDDAADGETEEDADVEQRSLLFGSVGLSVQYEHAGFGVSADGQRQALHGEGETSAGLAPTDLAGNFGIVHASIGYGFYDGQLHIGVGPRVTGVGLSGGSGASEILNVAGVGFQGGMIFKPVNHQYRVGATFKSAVTPALDSQLGGTEESAYRTSAIRLPWQASAGFAYQFGPRRLNPPFFSAEAQVMTLRHRIEQDRARRERAISEAERAVESEPSAENRQRLALLEAKHDVEAEAEDESLDESVERAEKSLRREYLSRPRSYVLLTTELLVLGASNGSIGFGSYYQGRSRVQVSGQNLTLSPRIGLETEVIENWLKLRAGSYWEPARVETAKDRIHGTFGFELKTFSWDVFGLIGDFDSWTVSAAIDGAREYLSTSFSIGFWH